MSEEWWDKAIALAQEFTVKLFNELDHDGDRMATVQSVVVNAILNLDLADDAKRAVVALLHERSAEQLDWALKTLASPDPETAQ